MSDVQESYPTPTSGLGKPFTVVLSGTGVTQVKAPVSGTAGIPEYSVSLSLAGTSSVAVTVTAVDEGGNAQSITGTINAISYNALPSSANAGDVQESYPVPNATLGRIATTTNAGSPFTVTAVRLGQAVVEFQVPFANNTVGTGSGSNFASGFPLNMIYAQLLVNVGA